MDTVLKFRKELEFLMMNMDNDNILNLDALKLFNVEDLFAQNVVTNTIVTQTLVADKGYIAELTVDQLDTSDKVNNYLVSDTSDVNYIKIYDQTLEFITAITTGSSTEQLTNRNGELVYWIDSSKEGITYENTGIPVIVYTYDETIKMTINFMNDPETGFYSPLFQLGAGDGVLDFSAKGFIKKGQTGVDLLYYASNTADKRKLTIGDLGISVDYNNQTITDGVLRNIHISDTEPSESQEGDLFIDTDDYSRHDIESHSSSATLTVDGGEVIIASGTITLTLFTAVGNAGVIRTIKNTGTGTITIATDGTETIDGSSSKSLASQYDVARLISDGSNWLVI
jgi:hypothetical protein